MRALLEKRSSSNVSEATVQLLKSLQIPVTATTAIEQVESHPDFPSLYSISDSLKNWKVDNAAFQVDADKLDSLPTPFIAHTKSGGGSFVLVKNVNGAVEYIDERGKAQKADRESFSKQWTNTVLLAEKNKHSGEKDFGQHKRAEQLSALRLPFIIAAAASLVLIYALLYAGAEAGIAASLLLVTKLAGCGVTGLLLWFEIDKANPLLQQICTGGKHTNCTAVLGSRASKVFSWLSWSEVGFFYFAGSFLSLLLSVNYQLPTVSVLSWLNLLALPYTVFSVFYQWRIAKQWCPLCLTVQALLLVEFIISYFGYWFVPGVTLSLPKGQLIPLLTSFLLPVLFWMVAKPAFLTTQKGKLYKKELSRLKYNKEIFTALLQKQKKITLSTEGLGIMLGNPGAKHTIIKVCNPYCGPCAKAHTVIDELVEGNEDIKVQIIFTATNDEKDRAALPAKHLMAIYGKGDTEQTQKALDDWYGADKKDYGIFKMQYPLTGELDLQGVKLEAMDAWCKAINISFTPTIFVDGYQLPNIYKTEDLNYLI